MAAASHAAFWTFTVIAVPGCVLSTAAYFSSSPAFLAQLSPFRIQYFALLVALALFCVLLRRSRWATLFFAFAAFNAWAVLRPVGSLAASSAIPTRPTLKILLANVLSSNTDPAPLLALITKEKPDFIGLLEINLRWQGQLSAALLPDYPHNAFYAREDNFGLAAFSRLPPDAGRAEYFADVETPSFDCTLPLGGGGVRILLTHPLPPGNPSATALRDQHLHGLEHWVAFIRGLNPGMPPMPTVILGDFNSTPWCPPFRRLMSNARLRLAAPNLSLPAASWPTTIPFLRIPLDHALLNELLRCTSYRVGPNIGSDHFPVILEIQPSADAIKP